MVIVDSLHGIPLSWPLFQSLFSVKQCLLSEVLLLLANIGPAHKLNVLFIILETGSSIVKSSGQCNPYVEPLEVSEGEIFLWIIFVTNILCSQNCISFRLVSWILLSMTYCQNMPVLYIWELIWPG